MPEADRQSCMESAHEVFGGSRGPSAVYALPLPLQALMNYFGWLYVMTITISIIGLAVASCD